MALASGGAETAMRLATLVSILTLVATAPGPKGPVCQYREGPLRALELSGQSVQGIS